MTKQTFLPLQSKQVDRSRQENKKLTMPLEVTHLDLLVGREWHVTGLLFELALALLRFRADERHKVCGEVTSQERFVSGYGEERGEKFGGELRLEHHQTAMHTTSAQVWRVLTQVDTPQPLHHTVVCPQHHLCKNLVNSTCSY